MAWTVELSSEARKSLSKLGRPDQIRLVAFFSDRLASLDDPRRIGQALKGEELGKYWKYRVGDWRVVVSIDDQAVKILVLRIGHRREVYR